MVPGDEPGTVRDAETGALYALPSSLGTFHTLGPVSRDEFNDLVRRLDLFEASITAQQPERVAAMVAAMEGLGDGPG